ncbi:MAG: RDD family protein [Wenzhouxiangella sp.]|nr:RDD family protein [Wenzhouxiangella sp.]MCH8478161.1 RDD family protein [Wenzhouxiangella sp.]TVR98998.1 MAG: RDD family protein [Wenzhouxiangellaceae bacterium]
MTESTQEQPSLPPPCGLIRRLAAMTYDGLLLVAIWMIAAVVIVIPLGAEVRPSNVLFQLYLLAVGWLYFAICWRGGQTLGMKAWHIHLQGNQQPVSWLTTLVRFLVAVASLGTLGLGFIWSLFHPRRQTWHDLASGTRLVIIRPERKNKKSRTASAAGKSK